MNEQSTRWRTVPIKRFAAPGAFTDGDWIESPFITDSGVRLLQTGNVGVGRFKEQGFRYISEESFTALRCTEVRPGDVLICRLADPVGRACLAPDLGVKMITSVDVAILRPTAQYDARFIVHALSSAPYLGYLESICRGGTRDRVSRSMLGDVPVRTPPLPQQRAIADFLDHRTAGIDSLIEKAEQMLALLGEKRQALVAHAVTKGLDPSSPQARLAHAVTKGLDPNAAMRDSGVEWLGAIPAGWQVSRSKRLFQQRKQRANVEDEQLTASQAYGVIPQREYTARTGQRVVQLTTNFELRKRVERDDFVISMRSFEGGLERAWASGGIRSSYVVLQPSNAVDVGYFTHLFKCSSYVGALQRTALFIRDGQDLTFDNFVLVDLPLPPREEQRRIAHFLDAQVSALAELFDKTTDVVEKLREYRQALITAAVTGQIDVAAQEAA